MKKSVYNPPEIQRVELDGHISLQLNSDPTPEEEPIDWVMHAGFAPVDDPVHT